MVFPEDVLEAARPDGGEGLPHLGGEADVAEEPLGVVDVDRLRGDVEVAAPDERGVRAVPRGEEVLQPLEPGQLVGELGASPAPVPGGRRCSRRESPRKRRRSGGPRRPDRRRGARIEPRRAFPGRQSPRRCTAPPRGRSRGSPPPRTPPGETERRATFVSCMHRQSGRCSPSQGMMMWSRLRMELTL